jgi:hypothetical protein
MAAPAKGVACIHPLTQLRRDVAAVCRGRAPGQGATIGRECAHGDVVPAGLPCNSSCVRPSCAPGYGRNLTTLARPHSRVAPQNMEFMQWFRAYWDSVSLAGFWRLVMPTADVQTEDEGGQQLRAWRARRQALLFFAGDQRPDAARLRRPSPAGAVQVRRLQGRRSVALACKGPLNARLATGVGLSFFLSQAEPLALPRPLRRRRPHPACRSGSPLPLRPRARRPAARR